MGTVTPTGNGHFFGYHRIKEELVLCGYCALCRKQEMEMHGTILNEPGIRHLQACKLAKCKHPAHYRVFTDATGKPHIEAMHDARGLGGRAGEAQE